VPCFHLTEIFPTLPFPVFWLCQLVSRNQNQKFWIEVIFCVQFKQENCEFLAKHRLCLKKIIIINQPPLHRRQWYFGTGDFFWERNKNQSSYLPTSNNLKSLLLLALYPYFFKYCQILLLFATLIWLFKENISELLQCCTTQKTRLSCLFSKINTKLAKSKKNWRYLKKM